VKKLRLIIHATILIISIGCSRSQKNGNSIPFIDIESNINNTDVINLSEFANDITLNEALFRKIQTVYQNKDTFNLSQEEAMLLDKNYKAFIRNGANLDEKGQFN